MARERKTDVLVAGAGPVGLLAAALLTEAGVAVEIVDEATHTATHGYALALHPRSLEILDGLDLAEQLIGAGQRIDTVTLFDASRPQVQVSMQHLDLKFPFVLTLSQHQLEQALQQRLSEHRLKVAWNQRVSRLEQDGNGVIATVDHLDRVSGGYPIATRSQVVTRQHRVRAAWTLGADGARSFVRRQLGATFDAVGDAFRCGVFELECAVTAPHEMRVVVDAAGCSGLWPLPGGRCRWTFELSEHDAERIEDRRGEERAVTTIGESAYPEIAKDRLRELLGARAPWFENELGELFWSIEVGFERRLASFLGHQRVWIAGDAAHMMFPLGMHSMNAGFEEVSALAGAIAGSVRGDAHASALESYERERLAAARALVAGGSFVRTTIAAEPWVAEHYARIVECLPACGDQLQALLAQLGLELV